MIETSFNVQSNVSKLSIEQYGTNERSEKVNVIKVFHEIERGSPNVESLSLTNLSNLGRSPELGHGGLFSSPSDWWKLCQMLLNRGYPIMDVELLDINFYNAFESSVIEYSNQVNQVNITNNLLNTFYDFGLY